MKLILLLPLFFIALIPAYAETIPESIHGYETSGGEYSQIWMQWDGLDLVNATITLPDREWNEITIHLPIDKYSISDDGTMHIFSQINRYTQILLTAKYLDDDTMLIDARMSFHDESTRTSISEMNVMKLQYIADVTNKEFEEPSQQITILGNFEDLAYIDVDVYNVQLKTVDTDNHLVKIAGVKISYTVTRDGVILSSDDGYTGRFGDFNSEVKLNSSKFLANACYELNITASKDGVVVERTEDFLAVTYANTYGQTQDADGNTRLIQSDYNCNN